LFFFFINLIQLQLQLLYHKFKFISIVLKVENFTENFLSFLIKINRKILDYIFEVRYNVLLQGYIYLMLYYFIFYLVK